MKHFISTYKAGNMPEFQKAGLKINQTRFDITSLEAWGAHDQSVQDLFLARNQGCDFTISSMMKRLSLDENNKIKPEFMDFSNGYQDMQDRILRFNSKTRKVFENEPERIVQALRLKKRYGLSYDSSVQKSMEQCLKDKHLNRTLRYYNKLRLAIRGPLKDNNSSFAATTKDIIENGLYKLL